MRQAFEKTYLQTRVEIQDLTSAALGKDLHDNIGQLLNTAKMLIGIADMKADSPSDILKTADETLATAINEIRSLARSLDKEWLEQFDFNENLQTEIGRISKHTGIDIQCLSNNFALQEKGSGIILFRIVQEALQNAIKHAIPSRIRIDISEADEQIKISIYNNGKPFKPSEKATGMGLRNMKYRTEMLKGQIAWKSVETGDTEVIIVIPKKNRHENKDRAGR